MTAQTVARVESSNIPGYAAGDLVRAAELYAEVRERFSDADELLDLFDETRLAHAIADHRFVFLRKRRQCHQLESRIQLNHGFSLNHALNLGASSKPKHHLPHFLRARDE